MNIERVGGGIFDSNVFVVGDEKNCVIVDAGVDALKVQGVVGSRKVEAVFLTHGHVDHTYFAQKYAEKFSCKIFAHKNAKEYLENSHHNASDGMFEQHDFSNFVFFDGDKTFDFSVFSVFAIGMGGHTASDVAYMIRRDIFVGDILIGQSIGRVDLYGGSASEMKESLRKICALDFSTLHSGHGADLDRKTAISVAENWLKWL